MSYSKDEYNAEPIFYCTNCYNIAIKELTKVKGMYVCLDCGNVHNEETSFDNWTELYKKEYGKPFLIKEDN